MDCLLLKCNSKEDEDLVKQHFAKFTWKGEPIVRVKNVRDATHIELKEREVQRHITSWVPNYECHDDMTERFNSKSYGKWHESPRFKYKRVWRSIEEEQGIGTCDENDTWQEQMADEIVANRGAIVTGCGGCGKSRIPETVKQKLQAMGFAIEICALTHVSSANVEGDTILHQLCKNHSQNGAQIL